jgi:hypothetical protein
MRRFPATMAFSAIGIYSVNNSSFEIYLTALFGVAGFVWSKLGFPPAPRRSRTGDAARIGGRPGDRGVDLLLGDGVGLLVRLGLDLTYSPAEGGREFEGIDCGGGRGLRGLRLRCDGGHDLLLGNPWVRAEVVRRLPNLF